VRSRHGLARCLVGVALGTVLAAAGRAGEPQPTSSGPVLCAAAPAGPDAAPSAPADAGAGVPCLFDKACCCPPAGPRIYVTSEYLLWWFKNSPEPTPLVTSVPAAVANGPDNGVRRGSLADPNASVVLGGRSLDTGAGSGARFSLGEWLDNAQTVGIEGNYLFIAPTQTTHSVQGDGAPTSPLLSVPFFDVTGFTTPLGLPGPSARPINTPSFLFNRDFPAAIPGQTAAGFFERLESRLQGFELNGLFGLERPSGNGLRLDALGGFRYLNLRESLSFSTLTNGGLLSSDDVTYNTVDQFTTRNDFYGGQFGLRGSYSFNRIVVDATAKVALGDVRQQTTINGTTTSNLITFVNAVPGAPLLNYAGGIFAQPSNIGTFSRDTFAVLPELDLNVGYQVVNWARVFVGYSFLYVSNVARPGNAINPQLNVTRIPFNTDPAGPNLAPTGPAQPAFNFNGSNFWAQGMNLGLELRF
jgi:hypothetical protein